MKTYVHQYTNKSFDEIKDIKKNNRDLLFIYHGDLDTRNIQVGNKYYRWCIGPSEAEKKTGTCHWFFEEYHYNENDGEGRHNPRCPVCGYCNDWEIDVGEFTCSCCKSKLELRRNVFMSDDEWDCTTHTTLIKEVKPRKLDINEIEFLVGV